MLFAKHVILRIANPYGKEYAVRGFYQIAKNKLEKNEFLSINSDKAGQIIRDFIYIDDAIAKIKKVIEEKKTGIFNISTGEGKTLEDFLGQELSNFDTSLIHYVGLNKNEIKNSVLTPTIKT